MTPRTQSVIPITDYLPVRPPAPTKTKVGFRDGPRIFVPMAIGLLAIALFCGTFGVWGVVAPLSSAALAPGVIKVEGSRRTVQHLEGGIVREILVRDGDKVTAGQVLARLDDVASMAQHASAKSQRVTLMAQYARLNSEFAGLREIAWPPEIIEAKQDPRVADAIAAQTALFISRRTALDSQMRVIAEKIVQLNATITSAESQMKSHDEQITLLRSEIVIVAEVVRLGLEKKARLLGLQRQEASLIGNRSDLESQVKRSQASIAENLAQMRSLRDQQTQDVSGELTDVRQKVIDAQEREKQAADIAVRREIVAPVAGAVLNSRILTVGGVVKPGDAILDIVPVDDRLVAEVQVGPGDIDVVHSGLSAEIRLPAFKQRLVPFISGKVTFVSADAVLEERTQRSYYRAHIVFDEKELARLNGVHLTPGMPVEGVILVGERTFFEYLLQPLRDSFVRAFREQ
ncbi:HlyD family type I secretion periplasmic adaptor subunit [Reyranella sp. CPCC 100927]|uniref:HlyD family type I secretion periplasmic adaptor subunit n=1 Tax=Reyranella sp. CPCC 100927 TaxID=2599616 RepID=UPI0011B517BD|nr:HlyD family type I secretion periplasmic adaptor subunit [Reyranella sp. CPCC 100927]TWT01667.1 HlyD family type I secretion periplasmic adaptor subunit [Reyranella sp. CPCC 100927]